MICAPVANTIFNECIQELHNARSSFEQARFNLVSIFASLIITRDFVRGLIPEVVDRSNIVWFFVVKCQMARLLLYQLLKQRRGLNSWKQLVVQWTLIFVTSNRLVLS